MDQEIDPGTDFRMFLLYSLPGTLFGLLAAIAVLLALGRPGGVRAWHGLVSWLAYLFFGAAGFVLSLRFIPGENELEAMGGMVFIAAASVVLNILAWLGLRQFYRRR